MIIRDDGRESQIIAQMSSQFKTQTPDAQIDPNFKKPPLPKPPKKP